MCIRDSRSTGRGPPARAAIARISSSELGEELQIVLEEEAQVVHAVFQHREAVEAHAEGEARVRGRIDAAVAQHLGMHHPGARALEAAPRAVLAPPLHVDLDPGIAERKVRRPAAQRYIVALEERAAELRD